MILLAASACGSNPSVVSDAPLPGDAGTAGGSAAEQPQLLGTLKGSVKNGHLQFAAFTPSEPGASGMPGVRAQNFGASEYAGDEIWFATDPGDGNGTGSCTSAQYCGTVEVTNRTGRVLDDFFVEITEYTEIDPPGATGVSWAGSPFTYSQAYASVFANPTHIEAAFYGHFDVDQTKPTEFKWNNGTSTNYYFNIAVLGTVRRSDYLSSTQASAVSSDACAIAGNTEYFASTDDAETDVALPFPYTLYDKTYDRAVLGSNGYVLFERTGDSVPSLGSGATNTSLATAAPPGLYPFWDDLAFDADGGVCVATTGTVPNRTLTITWKNAKINDAQPSKGSWAASRITTTLIVNEMSDQYTFEYLLPSAGITSLTQGSSATTGEVGIVSGTQVGTDFSFNEPSPNIPAAAASYPFKLIRLPDAGPVKIPTTTPVLQIFNEMGAFATGQLPRAWKIDSLATPSSIGTYAAALNHTALAAGAGMSATAANGIYSFAPGPNDSSLDSYWGYAWDRAVGWLAAGTSFTGGTKSGDLYVQLLAPPDADLSGLELGYDIQKFRNGTNPSGFKIQLYYSTDGAAWTSGGSNFATVFAAGPNNTGFDPAPGSAVTVPINKLSVNIARGSTFYLAWNYTLNSTTSSDASNAQALAIDNVSILGDAICQPSCTGKQCGDSLNDGCGGTCPAVCGAGDVGCGSDADCIAGYVCAGRVFGSPTPNLCVLPGCLTNPRLGCGFVGAPCGASCTVNPTCESDTDCPSGYVCGIGDGPRYGIAGLDVCELASCDSSPATAGCSTVYSECGICPPFTPTDADIGGPGIAGSETQSLGVFTINGSGAQIATNSDQFNFAYEQVSGDCTIVARLTSLTEPSALTQSGVMIRNDFTAQSAMAQVKLFASGGAWFLYRSAANNGVGGGQLASPSLATSQKPWFKVTRRGNTFTGYARADDSPTWVQIGNPATIPMNTTVYVGLDVCSHDNTQLATGTLDSVVISTP
jgi:hypothetical protein